MKTISCSIIRPEIENHVDNGIIDEISDLFNGYNHLCSVYDEKHNYIDIQKIYVREIEQGEELYKIDYVVN